MRLLATLVCILACSAVQADRAQLSYSAITAPPVDENNNLQAPTAVNAHSIDTRGFRMSSGWADLSPILVRNDIVDHSQGNHWAIPRDIEDTHNVLTFERNWHEGVITGAGNNGETIHRPMAAAGQTAFLDLLGRQVDMKELLETSTVQVDPSLYADSYCTTPGKRDSSCLANAIAAARPSGSPIVLTCGQVYPYSGRLRSGLDLDARCVGNMPNNAQQYPTTIAFTGDAIIGPANGLSLHWVNLSVPKGARVIMRGIQQSNLDFSAQCGSGLSATTTASTRNGSTSIIVRSASGIRAGEAITGTPAIDGGAFVTAISGTMITLSKPATSTQATVSVSFSAPCLELAGFSGENFVDDVIPKLMVNTQSGTGLQLNGETGFTTENNFGVIKVSFNPQSPNSGIGNTIEFYAMCDSNTIAKIGGFYSPNVRYGGGVIFGNSTKRDSGADNEVIGLIDSTGGVSGFAVVVNDSVGNKFNMGVVNFTKALETLSPNQVVFPTQLGADPLVNGEFWPNLDLNVLYRSGTYVSYNLTGGPPIPGQYSCNIYAGGPNVGAPNTLTIQDCLIIGPASPNDGRWFRRVATGRNMWGAWREMTNGYTAAGTAGITSTTCTQWTDGLCTRK